LLDSENPDLLQDSTSKLTLTDTQTPLEECGSQKSNEILQDVVPNKKTLSAAEGFRRDSGGNKETLLSLKTSCSTELSEQDYVEIRTNETLGEKISPERLQVSHPQEPQEPQKYIRESTAPRYHGRKDNRSHAEIKASVESNATCDSSRRVNKSSSRRSRWDNGSQIASGKDRHRSSLQGRHAVKQAFVFKGNNVTMNRRSNIPSNQNNTLEVSKGSILLGGVPCSPAKVDMNFINFKRNQVLRKYENMRLGSNHRSFKDPFYQSKKWALEFHQKRGQMRMNQKARGHEFIIGNSSAAVGFKGPNLHPVIQSIPTLTMPRRHPARLDSVIRPPRIDMYPLSHEKIWELLPVSLNKAITHSPDKLCGSSMQQQIPPVATTSQNSKREKNLLESVPLANPLLLVPISSTAVANKLNPPPVVTHISTYLEDPRLKKRRDKSQDIGESGSDK